MKIRIDIIRYAAICLAMTLCGVNMVEGSEAQSSKVIVGKSYRETRDTVKVNSTKDELYILPKSQINTTIKANKQANEITIAEQGRGTTSQSFGKDLVVININGITLLTKNLVESSKGGSSAAAASSKADKADMAEERYAKAAERESSYDDISSDYYASDSTYEIETEPKSSGSSKGGFNTIASNIETSLSLGLGYLSNGHSAAFDLNLKVRALYPVAPFVKVGASIGTNMYVFPPHTSINYTSKVIIANVLSFAVGADLLLEDLYEKIGFPSTNFLPARFMTDIGFGSGYGANGNGLGGFYYSPGFAWNIKDVNDGFKLFAAFNYESMQLYKNGVCRTALFSIGCKF